MTMFNNLYTAENTAELNYIFTGSYAEKSGYAEGTIIFTSHRTGEFALCWADNEKVLDDYYPIAVLSLNAGESRSVRMGYHTAIPVNATRIMVTEVKNMTSVIMTFSLPLNKQLYSDSGKLLYRFNSYSDVHLDSDGYYRKADVHFREALAYGIEKNTDFMIFSGDMVTNASGSEKEWEMYKKILDESAYNNPIWQSNGNHDLRCGVAGGLRAFIGASALENHKPYYSRTEKSTGDLFIFMALEKHYNPSSCDEFSEEQMDWVTELIETYYHTGINIYLIEHSPIQGFGAGDRMSNPYYKALLSENYPSTVRLKNLLKTYKHLIFLTGHTHEDFEMNYNYSNENNTACHMIHNSAVAGSTRPSVDDTFLDYNDGNGYHSQGYYVEVYERCIVFYGANLTERRIYPKYCYIMEGSRHIACVNVDTKPSLFDSDTAFTE